MRPYEMLNKPLALRGPRHTIQVTVTCQVTVTYDQIKEVKPCWGRYFGVGWRR